MDNSKASPFAVHLVRPTEQRHLSRRARALIAGGLRALVFAFALACLPSAQAHPHSVPAPVDIFMEINKGILHSTISVDEPLFRSWVKKQGRHDEPTKDDALEFFRKHFKVKAEGSIVDPFVKQFQFTPALDLNDVLQKKMSDKYVVILGYRLEDETIPSQVEAQWDQFEGVDWEGQQQVPITLKSPGNFAENLYSPIDPNYTWHANEHKPREVRVVERIEAKPPEEWNVPLSLGIVALALLAVFLVRPLRRSSWALRGSVLAVSALGAWMLWPTLMWTTLAPGSAGSVLPTEAEANVIVEHLVDNVYKAFDADDEDAIYDRLMTSVDGTLINDVYAEVYESRILRESGGVIVTIEGVEHTKGEIYLPEESWQRHFYVRWEWKVRGAITHLGHTHRRVNIYAARLKIVHTGSTWKIGEQEILEHEREDLNDYPEGQDPFAPSPSSGKNGSTAPRVEPAIAPPTMPK